MTLTYDSIPNREVRDVIREACEQGWVLERKTGSGHFLLRHPETKAQVTAPGTPSDSRFLANLRADLERGMPKKNGEKVEENDVATNTWTVRVTCRRYSSPRTRVAVTISPELKKKLPEKFAVSFQKGFMVVTPTGDRYRPTPSGKGPNFRIQATAPAWLPDTTNPNAKATLYTRGGKFMKLGIPIPEPVEQKVVEQQPPVAQRPPTDRLMDVSEAVEYLNSALQDARQTGQQVLLEINDEGLLEAYILTKKKLAG